MRKELAAVAASKDAAKTKLEVRVGPVQTTMNSALPV